MNARHTLFSYPRSQDNAALYQCILANVDALNRLVVQIGAIEGVDVASIETSLANIQSDVATVTSAVEELQTSGDLTPQQSFELSLITAVSTVLGSVSKFVNDTISQSESAAEATIRSLITSRQNTTSIRTEQQTRLTEKEAFATQLSTITAQLATAGAALTDEQTARANGDNALSSRVTTAETSIAGNSAAVSVVQSSVDGINAKYGVTITSQGYVKGIVQLDGSPAGSGFTVGSDTFTVGRVADSTVYPVFAIDTISGQEGVAIHGNMIADGAISARSIAALAVTADKIDCSNLSAINADLGTITAGTIYDRAVNPRCTFDLALQKWSNSAGSYIDMINGRILFVGV